MSKITDNITDIRNIETVTSPIQSQLDNLKNGIMLLNTDLNTILQGGRYGVIGTGNTNTAKAGEHSLEVLTDGSRTMQIAVFTDSSLYTRYYDTTWSSWTAASSGGGTPSDITPNMNGTGSAGTSSEFSRGDHIHPSDTSKQDVLVSGTSIKTINSASLLGPGNIYIANSYPESFSWTDGTTAGPTGVLSGYYMSDVSIGSIPSASYTKSGIVNTSPGQQLVHKDFIGANGGVTATYSNVTQDGVTLYGRNGGSSGYRTRITPGVLTSTNTVTLPTTTGTLALTSELISQVSLDNSNSSNHYIVFYSATSGKLAPKVSDKLIFNPNTGLLNNIKLKSINNTLVIGDSYTFENSTTAASCIAIGSMSQRYNYSANGNVSVGVGSMKGNSNVTGVYNTCLGMESLQNISSGYYNVAVGASSGKNITTGNYNVILGNYTGDNIATSNNNIILSDGEGNIRMHIKPDGTVDSPSTLGLQTALISGTTIKSINNQSILSSGNACYAPTSAGTSGYILKANGGTNAPTWINPLTSLTCSGLFRYSASDLSHAYININSYDQFSELIYRYNWTLGTTITANVTTATAFSITKRYALIHVLGGGGGGGAGIVGETYNKYGGAAATDCWTIIDLSTQQYSAPFKYKATIGAGGAGGTATVPASAGSDSVLEVYLNDGVTLVGTVYSVGGCAACHSGIGTSINQYLHPLSSAMFYEGSFGTGDNGTTYFAGYGGGASPYARGGNGGNAAATPTAGGSAAANTGAGGGAGALYNTARSNGGAGGSGKITIYYAN